MFLSQPDKAAIKESNGCTLEVGCGRLFEKGLLTIYRFSSGCKFEARESRGFMDIELIN